jgi:fucose permease
LGTLFGLPAMRSRLGVDLSQQGDLFLLLFVGVCSATLAVGPLIDRFGNKMVLLLSAIFVTASLLGLAVAHSMLVAGISVLVMGAGGGGLNTAANVLVSDLYGDNRGPMLNLLGIFYAFGALFIPLVVASVASVLPIPQLLVASSILPALCVIAYAVCDFPPAREGHNMSWRELGEVVRYPGLLLFGLLLFLESGNENVIGGWTSTYVGSMGAGVRTATWVLAAYWAALMFGRLSATRFLRSLNKLQLVLLSAIGSVVGTVFLLSTRSVPIIAAGVVFYGFSCAAIYPTVLAIVGDRYPRYAATVFGLLFAFGLAGGAVFPWAVGQISQATTVRWGMLVPLVGAIVVSTVAVVIRRRTNALQKSAAP